MCLVGPCTPGEDPPWCARESHEEPDSNKVIRLHVADSCRSALSCGKRQNAPSYISRHFGTDRPCQRRSRRAIYCDNCRSSDRSRAHRSTRRKRICSAGPLTLVHPRQTSNACSVRQICAAHAKHSNILPGIDLKGQTDRLSPRVRT
jgi:hypothetical protein